MFITQPNGSVIGNIYRNDSTKHNYSTVLNHYSCSEFKDCFEKFKQTIDVEKLHKRLLKFMALTTLSNAYVYLGKMNLLTTTSTFDVFINKEGNIIWGMINYSQSVESGKTLSNMNQQRVNVGFINNNTIDYYYNEEKIAQYNINEDTVEIISNERIESINNFNAFLTQWCNKTLRVAVAIEGKIEIMEISY